MLLLFEKKEKTNKKTSVISFPVTYFKAILFLKKANIIYLGNIALKTFEYLLFLNINDVSRLKTSANRLGYNEHTCLKVKNISLHKYTINVRKFTFTCDKP